MRAGKLRHRVSLQRRENVRNPVSGSFDPTWVPVADLWASVEPISAREFVAASAVQSAVTTMVTVRRREIAASMRIVYRGKVYNIEGVLPDKTSGLDYLTLPCSEGVNEG